MPRPPERNRKSVQKGLGMPLRFPQDQFPQKVLEKMGEVLERALQDSMGQDERNTFVLKHAYLVALYRQAFLTNQIPERDRLGNQINQSEKKGCGLGFSVEEMWGLNRLVRDMPLESLLERLKEKMGTPK